MTLCNHLQNMLSLTLASCCCHHRIVVVVVIVVVKHVEVNFDAEGKFVQEFISNPLLIGGR